MKNPKLDCKRVWHSIENVCKSQKKRPNKYKFKLHFVRYILFIFELIFFFRGMSIIVYNLPFDFILVVWMKQRKNRSNATTKDEFEGAFLYWNPWRLSAFAKCLWNKRIIRYIFVVGIFAFRNAGNSFISISMQWQTGINTEHKCGSTFHSHIALREHRTTNKEKSNGIILLLFR